MRSADCPQSWRMNARTEGFEFHYNSTKHKCPYIPGTASHRQCADCWLAPNGSVLRFGWADLRNSLGQWMFSVVLTPTLMGCIQIFGAGFIICLERHTTRGKKLQKRSGSLWQPFVILLSLLILKNKWGIFKASNSIPMTVLDWKSSNQLHAELERLPACPERFSLFRTFHFFSVSHHWQTHTAIWLQTKKAIDF